MENEGKNFIYGNKELNIPGCVGNGIPEAIAKEIYRQMQDFAKYAFNKSHAACYAAISMQTAYLKANYPLEFAAGLLTSVMDRTDKLALYVTEFRRNGFHILPPDINKSRLDFSIEDGDIRYGLSAIKDVGKAAKSIVNERKKGDYSGFMDFITRNAENLNKKEVEALIKAGALDFTSCTKYSMLQCCSAKINAAKKDLGTQVPGQISLFDLIEGTDRDNIIGDTEVISCRREYAGRDLSSMEKEALGFYLTRHPLDIYEGYFKRNQIFTPSALLPDDSGVYPAFIQDGFYIAVAGLVSDIHRIVTKKGDPMAFLSLDDGIASADVVVFPSVYTTCKDTFDTGDILSVRGRVSFKGQEISILADNVVKLADVPRLAGNVWITMDDGLFHVMSPYLNHLLDSYPGEDGLYIRFRGGSSPLVSNRKINYEAAKASLEDSFGVVNVVLETI